MRADASTFQDGAPAHNASIDLSSFPKPASPSLADSIRALRSHDLSVSTTAAEPPAHLPYRTPQHHQSYAQTYDEPRSPREKLDALLAEEAHHTAPASWPKPAHPLTPPAGAGPSTTTFVAQAPSPAYAQLRHPASPSLGAAAISPPASPISTQMPPPSRPNRPDTRPMAPARNPSIESATSSLSSASTSQQRAANPPDLAALVAAAGSPDAALLAMWRDKQSTTTHNAQLWRLVEKQRSMIIGLQKDLERALKDKDRYRRKFKELSEHAPPVPGALHKSDAVISASDRETSQSPAPSEKHEELTRHVDQKATEHKTSPLTQDHSAPDATPAPHLAHSPAHSSGAPSASNPTSTLNTPTDHSIKPLNLGTREQGHGHGQGQGLGLEAAVLDTSHDTLSLDRHLEQPQTPPQRPSLPATAHNQAQLQAPQISLIHATPVLGGDGFESPLQPKPAHPQRKAPPAPLNLSQPVTTSAHLHLAVHGDDEESDYDDTLEVDEIPIVERGRRKTREEDDRVREAIYAKDEEARSKSKKHKSQSKGKQNLSANTPSINVPRGEELVGAPSTRAFNPLQAGLPLSPRHPPPSSLNAMLSPTHSDSSMTANRSVGSPLSPGLPSSPRPGDRPLGSPLPRSPKQSLLNSPPMNPGAMVQSMPSIQQVSSLEVPGSQTLLLSPGFNSNVPDTEDVYRGLVSDQYPGLLLPPNALPSIQVQVFSSRLRPSRLSILIPKPQEEDPVFILAIYARSNNRQLWRVEKTTATLPALDDQLRSSCDFQGKLPDRALFGGHAPAKIDARRVALNQYFDAILETLMDEKTALIVCEYLSSDVLGIQGGDGLTPEPAAAGPTIKVSKTRQRKEGYLTKRGKNFGGWKARFFVLDGPDFKYYEVEGGAHLGTIKLQNAQIGKQSQQQNNQSPQRKDDSEDNQYRHAFLILEPKRKDSSSLVRHVLCAENDEERDAWVEALLQHVDYSDESPIDRPSNSSSRLQKHKPSQDSMRSQAKEAGNAEKPGRLQGLSYDDTIAAEAPVRGPNMRDAIGSKDARASPKHSSFSQDALGHYPAISGPSNGAPIKDIGNWGNKLTPGPTSVKEKKRSIFGFRGRGSNDLVPVQANNQVQSAPEQRSAPPPRSIFGIPLQEAVEASQPAGISTPLPAVVYRCLEYLKAKQAINEEGIFRLSGSNIVIKGLRDRFNNEGDIKLLEGQYYDVHAVASLLKLYLRELPSSILTRDLHLDFLKVLDMDERSKKIKTFNVLVHQLPRINFELLRHLSSFLIEIVDNSGINKMTVRNVGIVFAPTLNIPAPLISFFLTDYPDIFGAAIDEASSPINELRENSTSYLGDDAIRSPRRQMFSDIPTPAYNETTFSQRFYQPPNHHGSAAPSYPPPQPPQQQQHSQYGGNDSGFIPIHPTYEAQTYQHPYTEGFGSLNGAVSSGNSREERQKRRESGMLLMNMNLGMGAPRKVSTSSFHSNHSNHSGQRMDPRTNPMILREETASD